MKKLIFLLICLTFILCGCSGGGNYQEKQFDESFVLKKRQEAIECENRYIEEYNRQEKLCGINNVKIVSETCERRVGGCLDYKLIPIK